MHLTLTNIGKVRLAAMFVLAVAATTVWLGRSDTSVSTGKAQPRLSSAPIAPGTFASVKGLQPAERLAAFVAATRIDMAKARLVGLYAELDAVGPTRVYRVPTTDGNRECLLVVDAGIASSCLQESLFEIRDIAFLISFEAGQTPSDLRRQRVIGMVNDKVDRLEVVYTDGSSKALAIRPNGAFIHVVPGGELRRGTSLASFVAYDTTGRVVERLSVGN